MVRPNAIESDTPAIDERRGGGIGDPSIPRRWICNVMKSSRAEGGGKPKKKGGPKSIDSAPFRSYGFYRHVKKKPPKNGRKKEEKKNLIEFYGCVPPHTHTLLLLLLRLGYIYIHHDQVIAYERYRARHEQYNSSSQQQPRGNLNEAKAGEGGERGTYVYVKGLLFFFSLFFFFF